MIALRLPYAVVVFATVLLYGLTRVVVLAGQASWAALVQGRGGVAGVSARLRG